MTRRRKLGVGLGGFAIALITLILLWDWNWFRGPVEARVEQQTGRRFVIGGDLDVDLGWNPRVRMEQVSLGNPSWARTPQMFEADIAELTLDLRALLAGRLYLPRVALVAPRLELETAPGNENNWQLARQSRTVEPESEKSARKGLPEIGSLSVERGELAFFDPAGNTELEIKLDTRVDKGVPSMVVSAGGRLRTLDFEAEARGGSLLALADLESPYPFDTRFRVGRTRGSAEGTITGLQALHAMRLQLDVRGESLADLHRLTGLALPETPPYHVAGLLERAQQRWTFKDFTGEVGDSDLAGDAAVSYSKDGRPRLEATLVSRQLDLDDLAGFVGGTPQVGAGETASVQQASDAAAADARAQVLPDHPVDLARLGSMDADVRFSGHSIRNRKAPLDDLNTHLKLEGGVLRLDPLDFGVAGGSIKAIVQIDAREAPLSMETRLDFTRLDLSRLLPGNENVKAGAGMIGGRAHLRGTGASTAALLGSADGELGIAMRDGEFSNLLIEGLGLDAAEVLRLLVGGDQRIQLRCGVMELEARDGVVRPRSFVVDTTDTNVHVEGSLSLRDETLDLTIFPLPKDFSPLTLRSPLHVRGTFKDPSISPDKALFLRGGIAGLLGALVNPLAALLPLIETGPGKNEDCEALVAAVKQHADGKPVS